MSIMHKSKTDVYAKHRPFRQDFPFYILILPTIIVVFLFRYLPMFGLLIAFKDYNPRLGIFGSPWTDMGGFANFAAVFRTPSFSQAIWNTLFWNLLTLVVSFPAPIILALLINEINNKVFKKTVQTISYLPHFLSTAAITTMVNNLLDSYGLLNGLLSVFRLEPVYLLRNHAAFLPTYLIVNVWQTVGWGSIIFLATLSGISQELYEAAEIDGANRFRRVWHITLPALIPTTMILLIMRIGTLFSSSFEIVYGLQNPIAWTDEVIATAVWKYGIGQGEYSMSTALNLMQGVIAMLLTFGANAISGKVSKISMW